MKIIICASIQFTNEINEISRKLELNGHVVEIPLTSQKILNGEITLEEFNKENLSGEGANRKIQDDVIKKYYNKIKDCDCILVLNYSKNGIENYIGGNTFLEMGFAHVLDKKIFLLNEIPNISYSDEIEAMMPRILNGDILKVN
jgi:nucleoside 2-deoxyribosyltransferase